MSHMRVMIASVSMQEGRQLRTALERAGWDAVQLDGAGRAAREIAVFDRAAVLLIDAGLLQAIHDGQWRELRACHPDLGTIVRCLGNTLAQPDGADDTALTVHPDDLPGISQAIRRLGWQYRASA